MLWWGIL